MCLKVYPCSTIRFSQNIRESVYYYLADFLHQIIDIQQKILLGPTPSRKFVQQKRLSCLSSICCLLEYSGKILVSVLIGCIAAPRYSMSSAQSYSATCWYTAKVFLVRCGTAKKILMSLTNLLIFTKRFFLISMLICGIAALPQLLKISAESARGHAQVPLVNVPKKHLNGQHHI